MVTRLLVQVYGKAIICISYYLPVFDDITFKTETEVLKQASILVKDSLEPCSPTVFLTDALSVLEALQTNN